MIDWAARHAAELEAWAEATKKAIKKLAEHHRRAIGQLTRRKSK